MTPVGALAVGVIFVGLYLAATVSTALGVAWVLTVASLAYAASCTWWPYAKCLRCEGEGKFRRGDGRVWRKCKRCGGDGARLRVGRKVWNYLHHQKKAAK